jgi:hypothetical protein
MPLASRHSFVWLFLVSAACGQAVIQNEPPQTLAKACELPASSSSLVEACTAFTKKRDAYATTCGGFTDATYDEQAAIDSCVGIANLPGSSLTPADIDQCSSDVCSGCGVAIYPACVGYEGNLLYPNHEKKGTAAPGDSCVAHLQCASGYCSSYGEDCGHCEAARLVGDTCTGPYDACVDTNAACTAGVCQLNGKQLGEACVAYGEGDCQTTLFCKVTGTTTIDGVCVARGAAGAPCAMDPKQCAEGNYCRDNACAPLLADGAPCDATDLCVQSCIDGICGKPVIPLHENDDCSSAFGCGNDLYCKDGKCAVGCGDDPNACAPKPKAGEACDPNSNCAPNAVCVGFDPSAGNAGLCTRQGGEGDACPCGDDLACVDGRCVAFGAAICN